jgi:Dynamin central region
MSLEAARVKESQLFASPNWSPGSSGIQPDRMGIAALRTGLSNVFCAHIRDEFPFFKRQTEDKLIEKRNQLNSLGPARSTVSEQRDYLRTIVAAYQDPKFLCLNDDLRSEPHVSKAYLLTRKLTLHKKSFLRDSLTSTGAVWAFKTPVAGKDDASDLAASALYVAIRFSFYLIGPILSVSIHV